MENKQTNSTIKSRAAVAFAPNQPLQIVEIDVEMPRKGEVLIRNTHTVCAILMHLRYQEAILKEYFLWCLGMKVRVWLLLWVKVCQA